jgi:hypothetical protein
LNRAIGFIHWTVTASAFLHYNQNIRHMNLETLSEKLLFPHSTTLCSQLLSGISLRIFTDLLNRSTSAIIPPALCHTSATPSSQRPNLKHMERSSGDADAPDETVGTKNVIRQATNSSNTASPPPPEVVATSRLTKRRT